MTVTAETVVQMLFGEFKVRYHEIDRVGLLSFSRGTITEGRTLVRIQSACLLGQTFGSSHCDCDYQLRAALNQISVSSGVVVFSPRGEGKGAGLEPKIRAMELERTTGCSPAEAYHQLGLPSDLREFREESQVLIELGVTKRIRMSTENERKRKAILEAGFELAD